MAFFPLSDKPQRGEVNHSLGVGMSCMTTAYHSYRTEARSVLDLYVEENANAVPTEQGDS